MHEKWIVFHAMYDVDFVVDALVFIPARKELLTCLDGLQTTIQDHKIAHIDWDTDISYVIEVIDEDERLSALLERFENISLNGREIIASDITTEELAELEYFNEFSYRDAHLQLNGFDWLDVVVQFDEANMYLVDLCGYRLDALLQVLSEQD